MRSLIIQSLLVISAITLTSLYAWSDASNTPKVRPENVPAEEAIVTVDPNVGSNSEGGVPLDQRVVQNCPKCQRLKDNKLTKGKICPSSDLTKCQASTPDGSVPSAIPSGRGNAEQPPGG